MADAPAADVEKAGVGAPAGAGEASGGGGAVGAIVGRWRRQDLLDKSGSALRAAAWAFSLLAFLVMVANEHGDWRQFDHYEEYRLVRRQVHRRRRVAGVRLHHAAAGAARRPAHRRPGPAEQGRPARRLRRGSGNGVPCDVGAVRGDPDHQPHARGLGQRVHRLVRCLDQHGLLRLRLSGALGYHLGVQALQADVHMRLVTWARSLPRRCPFVGSLSALYSPFGHF